MNPKDIEKIIREYLPQIVHLSLATCVGGKPWVSELHYVYDDDLNLYFRSKTHRRHSKEMEENSSVAGNIITQHKSDEDPRGVYFEGKAEIVNDLDENHPVYKLFCERFDLDEEILRELKDPEGHRFYKISVENYYLFDARGPQPAGKHKLPWNSKIK